MPLDFKSAHYPKLVVGYSSDFNGGDSITGNPGNRERGLKRAGVDEGEVAPKGGAAGVVSVISRSTPDTDLSCKYESSTNSLTRSLS